MVARGALLAAATLVVTLAVLIPSARAAADLPTTMPCGALPGCDTCIGQAYQLPGKRVQYCKWCPMNGGACLAEDDSATCKDGNTDNAVTYPASAHDADLDERGVEEVYPKKQFVFLRKHNELQVDLFVQPVRKDVQLYYLMDMSNSMTDDRLQLIQDTDVIYNTLQSQCKASSNDPCVSIGFGTFIEKPIQPFGGWTKSVNPSQPVEFFAWSQPDDGDGPDAYNYVWEQSLDFAANNGRSIGSRISTLTAAIRETEPRPNLDHPEAMLEALLQVASCDKHVKWDPAQRHIVFVATDADFHQAGDGARAGIFEPNPGTCYSTSNTFERMDFDVKSLEYDYPSVSQVRARLLEKNIVPVFAVAEPTDATLRSKELKNGEVYKTLTERLGFGVSQVVSGNGNDIPDALNAAYRQLTTTAALQAKPSAGARYLKSIPSALTGLVRNQAKAFKITLEWDGEGAGSDYEPLQLSVPGFGEATIMIKTDVGGVCSSCPPKWCNNVCKTRDDAAKCLCGGCTCGTSASNTWGGPFCSCSTRRDQCEVTVNGFPLTCSANGVCECNKCKCDAGYQGDNCSCSTAECPGKTSDGRPCSGNGSCNCGVCECNAGFTGSDCRCPTAGGSDVCTVKAKGDATGNPECGTRECSGVECREPGGERVTTGTTGVCVEEALAGCTVNRCDCPYVGWGEKDGACNCSTGRCTGKRRGCYAAQGQGECVCNACECKEGFQHTFQALSVAETEDNADCACLVRDCPTDDLGECGGDYNGRPRGTCNECSKRCKCRPQWKVHDDDEFGACDCFKHCAADENCGGAEKEAGRGTCACEAHASLAQPQFYESRSRYLFRIIELKKNPEAKYPDVFDAMNFVQTCRCGRVRKVVPKEKLADGSPKLDPENHNNVIPKKDGDAIEYEGDGIFELDSNNQPLLWTTAEGSFRDEQCNCVDRQCPKFDGLVCNGHGRCDCNGVCECDAGWVGSRCQCSSNSCPSSNGDQECGGPGRGKCDEESCQCVCEAGWKGFEILGPSRNDCSCQDGEGKTCPTFQTEVCSGRGECSSHLYGGAAVCSSCVCRREDATGTTYDGWAGEADRLNGRTDCSCDESSCLLENKACGVKLKSDGSSSGTCRCGGCECTPDTLQWSNAYTPATALTGVALWESKRDGPCVCNKNGYAKGCPGTSSYSKIFGECDGFGTCQCRSGTGFGDVCKCNAAPGSETAVKSHFARSGGTPGSLASLVSETADDGAVVVGTTRFYSHCRNCKASRVNFEYLPGTNETLLNDIYYNDVEKVRNAPAALDPYCPGQKRCSASSCGECVARDGASFYLQLMSWWAKNKVAPLEPLDFNVAGGCGWCRRGDQESCEWIVEASHCDVAWARPSVAAGSLATQLQEADFLDQQVRKPEDAEKGDIATFQAMAAAYHAQFVTAGFEQECPKPLLTEAQKWAVGGGTLAGLILIGLLAMLGFKAYGSYRDKKEWEQFEKDRQSSKWKSDANPLFQSSVSETTNPLYVHQK